MFSGSGVQNVPMVTQTGAIRVPSARFSLLLFDLAERIAPWGRCAARPVFPFRAAREMTMTAETGRERHHA
jgi:hypothetical protein